MPKFLYRSLFTALLLSIWLLSLRGQRLFAQEDSLFGSKRYVTRFLYMPSPKWGLPLVQVRLNGTQSATFLLDTGCSFCFITAELAQKMNLKTAPANMSDGTPLKINGTEMQAVDEQRLQLGNEEITTPFVVVQQAQIGFVPGVQLDGIIGFTALMDKALLLDPILHQVTLWSYSPSAAEREALHIQDAVSCQAFVKNSTLWVQIRLNNKVTTDVCLDTGANFNMLPIEVIKQLAPATKGKKELESTAKTFFGSVKTKMRIVHDAEILAMSGPGIKFVNFPIQYGPDTLAFYNSHLGMNVLQECYTLMDFIQKKVCFKPSAESASKFKVGSTSRRKFVSSFSCAKHTWPQAL